MAQPVCLIVQPIHVAGERRLVEAGVALLRAPSADTADVVPLIGGADAAITRNAGLQAASMDAAPKLRIVANHGVGVDRIDVAHATRLGIPVTNTPGGNTVSVAEQAIALMLALAKQIVPAHAAARAGDFDVRYRLPFAEVSGKVLGIVGFGDIGRATARMAHHGFGMRVLVHSPSAPAEQIEALGYAKAESLDALLHAADVVSLHLPLRDTTRNLIGRRELALMKPSAVLINTGRGPTLDEDALVEALREKRLAGAGLDVFSREPLPAGHPLLDMDNVVLSPHTASSTEECLVRMALMVAESVIDALSGRQPLHLVNPEAWERRRG
ncbi:MAG TPA: hydroxyacid dehydrogenase [Azospirillum sp.]|nr:hydroxyacid dehydrogenase [Azospirillum sp.]